MHNDKNENIAQNNKIKLTAPYNFIPFSENVLLTEIKDKIKHNQIGENLKSGEIHLCIEAKTPIIVSGGNKNGNHFFKGANGKYMIPGSTIAGLTRFNMNILGYGYLHLGENFEDYQIYYRAFANSAKGYKGEVKKHYYKMVVSPIGEAEKVNPGYLVKKGRDYYIYDVNEVIKVKKSELDPKFDTWQELYAKVEECKYIKGGQGSKPQIYYKYENIGGAKEGVVMFPGRPVKTDNKNKQEDDGDNTKEEVNNGTLYIFPKINYKANVIKLSEADIKSYKIDYETRQNVLGKNKSFWELPKNNIPKPIFYIKHDGHIYFGMTKLLRIGYKYNLSKGLKPKHVECIEKNKLDYVHNILGYSNKKEAFKSRVSFGDCQVCGNVKEVSEPIKVVLSGAKPSYFPNYLLDGKNYNDDKFELRGYKQYWLKKSENPNNSGVSGRVGSDLYPLPENTKFEGIIRYKNLTEIELGLLLYSLKLEDGCYQPIGMAKPYGYGRTVFTIEKLVEYNNNLGLDVKSFTENTKVNLDKGYEDVLINKYKVFISSNVSKGADNSIEDFIGMRKEIINGKLVKYNKINEYIKLENDENKPCLKSVKEVISENNEINK